MLQLLGLKPGEVLIESTGVIGQRIKKVNEPKIFYFIHYFFYNFAFWTTSWHSNS